MISKAAYKYIGEPVSHAIDLYPQCNKQHNANPFKLYQQSIDHFKKGNYQLTINTLNKALPLYKEKASEISVECANCYSTLASCYRALGHIKTAIEYSEQAITIFASVDKVKLGKITDKYHGCLTQAQQTPLALYNEAIDQIKGGKYAIALAKLFFVLKVYKNTNAEEEQASCYGAIASCYRELNEIDQAIEHCQTAIDLRSKIYGDQHPKTIQVKTKLAKLEESLTPKQTIFFSS